MVTVKIYSHHYAIVPHGDYHVIKLLYRFFRSKLSIWEFSRPGQPAKIDKTFASVNSKRTHFRILKATFPALKEFMLRSGVDVDKWSYSNVPMYTPAKADFKCIFPHPLREKQVEINEFILRKENGHYNPMRVIPLQMGGGKTLISLYTAAQIGQRTMIEVSKRYMENWKSNVYGADAKLDVTEKEVLILTSRSDLIKAIRKAKSRHERFNPKIIIAHKSLMSSFIKDYNADNEQFSAYGIDVEDIYKVLGVGVVIRDEAHEEIHAIAVQDLHRHCPLVINLSATIVYDDIKINTIANDIFPLEDRYNGGEWNRYIDVVAVHYGLKQPSKLKWQQFKNGPYNQPKFEKSILENKVAKERYFEMVKRLTDMSFIEIKENGDKLAIYAATIDMCTELTSFLKDQYKELMINRYVGEDDYEKLMTADIVVTTPGSAGTGVDIKGLRRVIMTNAMKSSQKNYQIAGRLRELVDGNGNSRDTVFYYLVCDDIPPHGKYHVFKKQIFRGKMKSHRDFDMFYSI